MSEKILINWSGGKDSAMALYGILKTQKYEICALLTTVSDTYKRICMHGVRQDLLEKQAVLLKIPLEKLYVGNNPSNEEYIASLRECLLKYKEWGVSSVVSGDIFLEDVKQYRDDNLSELGLKGLYPLWQQDTLKVANDFIDLGFKAIITCVDADVLDKSFVGRAYDKDFISDLPSEVDLCGENGEFHSFVYSGPIFDKNIPFHKGEIVLRDNRFYFCDLMS